MDTHTNKIAANGRTMKTMSETGRYFIYDHETGRKFCIEPLGRAQVKVFTNGGVDGTAEKNKSTPKGGATPPEESTITEENGFKDIVVIGPHMSPEAFIEDVCRKNLRLTDLGTTLPSMKSSPSIVVPKI